MIGRSRGIVVWACLLSGVVVAWLGWHGTDDRVVVRVAGIGINASRVAHRMAVLGAGGKGRSTHLRQEAVNELIDEVWLMRELERRGIRITAKEVRDSLRDEEGATFPGGRGELEAYLRQTRQEMGDLHDRVVVRLASERLRDLAVRAARKADSAEVARYYAKHRRTFRVAEERVLLINNRKHESELLALKAHVERKKDFAAEAERWTLTRPHIAVAPLERAIFRAKANVLTGPVKQKPDYFLFEVKDITPVHYLTLAEVASKIKTRMDSVLRQAAIMRVVAAWRARWRGKTHCQPGYVVQKCSEYKGSMVRESLLAFV